MKDWNPKPVYPPQADVSFQTNAVFRVNQGEERSQWTILEADVRQHTAEYVYVAEGERLSRVRVEIEPLDAKHCRVRVRYVHTATSEKGLQFVASVTEEAFAQKMRDWQHMVSAAIRLAFEPGVGCLQQQQAHEVPTSRKISPANCVN